MWYGARALAGLRVGYAISDDGLIEALIRVKNSFNSYPLGRPAQAGAIAALGDEEHFQRNRSMVIEERDRMTRELWRLGFEMLPSKANFVFADHPAHGGGTSRAAGAGSPFRQASDSRLCPNYRRREHRHGPTTGSPDPQSGTCTSKLISSRPSPNTFLGRKRPPRRAKIF